MSESMISAVGVSKRYVKYEDTPTLVGRVTRVRSGTKREALWALNDVNMEIGRGECVGVIGRNGSGKSTMLRMLAGVTAPTLGTIAVRGRVAPLIAVGVGFHYELTGRENVYMTATILGLTRKQIDARFEEIVDFSEVADFIDTPVKFYSSGMYVRLGFAVSVVSEPDVLLVDEVLAVGDLAFQMKCFDKMREIKDRGTTIVIVSHNLTAIQRLCERTAVIHDAALRFDGETSDAISRYYQLISQPREGGRTSDSRGIARTAAARFDRFELVATDGRPRAEYSYGETLRFETDLVFLEPIDTVYLSFRILDASGVLVYRELFTVDHLPGPVLRAVVSVPLNLAGGTYNADVSLVGLDATVHGAPPASLLFHVNGRNAVHGLADLHASYASATDDGDREPAPMQPPVQDGPAPL